MLYYYQDNETVYDEYGDHDDEGTPEDSPDDNTEEQEDKNTENDNATDVEDKDFEPIRWSMLKLGKTTLRVYSTGKVRREDDPFYYLTSGITLIGSPYRYIVVETEDDVYQKFYMHDIIWRAFNGDIPVHWEVRHKSWVPLEYNREYPNDLYCLEIYPKLTAPFESW